MINKKTSKEPLILAIETSGRKGSVALALGKKLLEEITFFGTMRHSTELFPAVTALLKNFNKTPQQIEQAYISIGPGSFTGLRIAVTFAKIMHLATETKIITVDTLDTIAANVIDFYHHKLQAADPEKIATVLDAKRNQFFAAVYQHQKNQWEKILEDRLISASNLLDIPLEKKTPMWLLGEGLVYYKEKFKVKGIKFFEEKYWWPKASKVHQLGWQKAKQNQFADPFELKPKYLRTPQIGISRMKSDSQSNLYCS